MTKIAKPKRTKPARKVHPQKANKTKPGPGPNPIPVAHGDPTLWSAEERLQEILRMRREWFSEYDIGQAIGISQGRVSHILRDAFAKKRTETVESIEQTVATELERLDHFILLWHQRARYDSRAADMVLRYIERRHKLMGLDITKTEISGRNGGSISLTASAIDITKLNDQQLANLEEIMLVAGPRIKLDGLELEHTPAEIAP